MKRGYKKSYLVINIMLTMLFLLLTINLFTFKNTSYLFLIMCVLIPTVLLILLFGYEKKKKRFTYELVFYMFAYCTLFLLVTYLIGTIIGFNKNIYKLNFSNLIHNIIPYFILIVVSEVLRYQIIRKGENSNLAYILVTVVLILVDMTMFFTTYDLNTGDGQIKYICSVVLPSIFKNALFIFFAKRGGLLPCLLYRLLIDWKLVIIPIVPAFGLHAESLIYTILPVLIACLVYLHIKDDEKRQKQDDAYKKTSLYKYIAIALFTIFALIVNFLTSCSFKYGMLSIGSGSMTPNINKGDAIVYEKGNKDSVYEDGSVIVFKKDDRTVVHRIIEIVDGGNGELIYYTQGDNNEKPDGYPILTKDIIGCVKFRIRYIGIPSVILSDLTK